MTSFVALLRAVNVGGTGKLAMGDLRALCERAGFEDVRTYLQSGNVVFRSTRSEREVKAALERALAAWMGKPVAVLVRAGAELASVLAHNPFPGAEPSRVVVLFLDVAPRREALAGLAIPGREAVVLRGRELFIHYPDGIGRSKLRVPLAGSGTGRNLNTVARLAEMATER